jgi:hypothetical protein
MVDSQKKYISFTFENEYITHKKCLLYFLRKDNWYCKDELLFVEKLSDSRQELLLD